jgi:hypothetical protein
MSTYEFSDELYSTVSSRPVARQRPRKKQLSKALFMIVDAPWYVPNMVVRSDLQMRTVKDKIRRYSSQYSARLSAHPNDLIVNLIELPGNRRLRGHLPNDLPTRFLV